MAVVLSVGLVPLPASAQPGQGALAAAKAAGTSRLQAQSLSAQADDIAGGTCGTCTWRIDAKGTMTIAPADGSSGTLDSIYEHYDRAARKTVSTIPWKGHELDVKRLVVEKGVVAGAHCNCMFAGFSNMTSADVSGLDTSNVTDMSSMFSGCSGLESLSVASFDTSRVTDMNNMFNYNMELATLDLSNFDTRNVQDMQHMFLNCRRLVTLDASSFDTSNVAEMGHVRPMLVARLARPLGLRHLEHRRPRLLHERPLHVQRHDGTDMGVDGEARRRDRHYKRAVHALNRIAYYLVRERTDGVERPYVFLDERDGCVMREAGHRAEAALFHAVDDE